MRQYLIPASLETLKKNCPDDTHWQIILEKINAVVLGEVFLTKKRFGQKIVYTCNADYGHHAHRLLFERVEAPTRYVLRSIAWNHDYEKALNFAPFTIEISPLFEVRTNDTLRLAEDNDVTATPLISYNNSWYELTSIQSDILKCSTFPQLIIGPPGSGKTLTAVAFFQERVLQKMQEGNEEPLRLLYLTGSAVLKDSVSRSWEDWIRSTFNNALPEQIKVEFLTFEEQLGASLNENQRLLSQENAVKRLRDLLKTRSCPLTAEDVFAEFLINSQVLMSDLAGSSPRGYEQSNYRNVGINKSSLDPKYLEYVYHLFSNFHAQMSEKQECVLGISILAVGDEASQFDFTVVDEAQNNPLNDLLNALRKTKNNQILFLGDSLQKRAIKVSSLPLLAPALHPNGITLTTHQLPGTHRLKPAVAAVANNLVGLYTYLKGGLADNTSYSSLSSHTAIPHNDNSLTWVAQCNDEYHLLGKNAHAAALIFDERDREAAKKSIGGHNVFKIEEAQGLEFSELFIYVSAETMKSFLSISNAMKIHGINNETVFEEKKNLSSQKGIIDGAHLEHLSLFYIALSRTYGNAWVYIEALDKQQNHQHRLFLSWLKSKFTPNAAPVLNEQGSSQEEWLAAIHTFIDQRQFTQAQSNLILHFDFSAQEAEKYVNSSVNQRYQSVSELNKRKQANQSASSSEAEPYALPSTPAASQTKAALVSIKTAPKTKEKRSIKKLTSKEAEWVEALWNKLSLKNIKSLLERPNATAMLFYHKMANGQCFFVNLCNKRTDLSELILNHLDKQPVEAVLHCLTESNQHISLLHERWAKIKGRLNLKNSEWFAALDNGSPFFRLCTSDDGLDFLEANWSDIKVHLSTERLFTSPTKEVPPFAIFFIGPEGIDFLNRHWDDFKHHLKAESLFAPGTSHGFSEITFFHRLCLHNEGLSFLDRHWDDFKKHLSAEGLFAPIISDGPHNGVTPFLALCSYVEGITLLDRHWDDIKKCINAKESLTTAINSPINIMNSFHLLLQIPEGFAFLRRRWNDFKKHLNSENLFTPITCDNMRGFTPFNLLCRHKDGPSFLDLHWGDFEKHLNTKGLYTPIISDGSQNGFTPFLALCSNVAGIILLSRHWEFFKKHLSTKELLTILSDESSQKIISPFYVLYCIPEGRNLIASQWESTFSALVNESNIIDNIYGRQLKALLKSSCPSIKNRGAIGFFSPSDSKSNESPSASSSFST